MIGEFSPDEERWEVLLLEHAAQFYRHGWVVGTSGNLSIRLPGAGIRITSSGRHKGLLVKEDLLTVDEEGRLLDETSSRPSAELSLHLAIYRRIPDARAVYHVHTIESNLVSLWASDGEIFLPPLEMLKGLGISGRADRTPLAVFDNNPDVSLIARQVDSFLSLKGKCAVPGFLIHLHGLTVWGNTPEEALKHVELFDYLFRFQVMARSLEMRSPSV
ncbi:MAG: methylthioribulose 1-phosphate dehydratase [Leptospirales bacterium]